MSREKVKISYFSMGSTTGCFFDDDDNEKKILLPESISVRRRRCLTLIRLLLPNTPSPYFQHFPQQIHPPWTRNMLKHKQIFEIVFKWFTINQSKHLKGHSGHRVSHVFTEFLNRLLRTLRESRFY